MVIASFIAFSQEKEGCTVNMYYELHVFSNEQEDMAQLEIFLVLILLITIRNMYV